MFEAFGCCSDRAECPEDQRLRRAALPGGFPAFAQMAIISSENFCHAPQIAARTVRGSFPKVGKSPLDDSLVAPKVGRDFRFDNMVAGDAVVWFGNLSCSSQTSIVRANDCEPHRLPRRGNHALGCRPPRPDKKRPPNRGGLWFGRHSAGGRKGPYAVAGKPHGGATSKGRRLAEIRSPATCAGPSGPTEPVDAD